MHTVVASNQLGADGWGQIAGAVKSHASLKDLVDFGWSPSVLKPGVADIRLDSKSLGDVGAVVLSHMLPRNGSTLETLLLR